MFFQCHMVKWLIWRSLLYSDNQFAASSRFSSSVLNRQKPSIFVRYVRLKLSIKAFCANLPDWVISSFTTCFSAHYVRVG
ncbi:hypothetical protein HMPREF9347_04336 [Escherichia coli MS 124-1]|nr:hypothetical protein HMPREF9347_04336 [Escherichia coli MS 124-1]